MKYPTFLALLVTPVASVLADPRPDTTFFNGKDLSGWSAGEGKYWSVKDGAIFGHAPENVPRNEFLWSKVEVKDFYLVVEVKLEPDNRNAGIQFRSKPVNEHGQAHGYQADVGAGVWGKLYHEHGRGKLDWNDRAVSAVKPGEWNRYEILAVGHRIWTAINGTLCVAFEDPEGELSGKIAFQIHGGPPQDVRYRVVKLVHDPEIALEKQNRKQLLEALPRPAKPAADPKPAKSAGTRTPENMKGWTPEVARWRARVDANDPGMSEKWFAPDTDDSGWRTMSLPRFYEGSGLPGHDGTTWFRHYVDVPSDLAGKDLTLEIGPIDDMDMTWFNGSQVGGIEVPGFWLKPRVYAVPGNLVRAGRNVITVRVIDHGYGGGFGAKDARSMKLHRKSHEPVFLHGDWRYRVGVTLKSLGLSELKNPAQPWHPGMIVDERSSLFRPLKKPASPLPGFGDGFEIAGDQTIVVFGGANAAEVNRHGWLETRLVTAHGNHVVRFRNMAWPTDTVYRQWRPRNFFSLSNPEYGEKDGRDPIAADQIFFWFGQMESLEGEGRVADFTAAYKYLVDEAMANFTGKVVLVTPPPFEDPIGLGLNPGRRNTVLQRYVAAIESIATDRDLPVVNLFAGLRGRAGFTSDGALLSEEGHRLVGEVAASQLKFSPELPSNAGYIRDSIVGKNRLWHQFWLPTNWAFLYGNRQTQPSSRDHEDPRRRWFPEEVRAILGEVDRLETEIRDKVK